ncbi:hypothetical protein LZ518_05945 [Sphingomonas sp. RB56-2]|uniref:Uncharacterized protein n=1 Tax=Sphingomonas brevis TaxID=2908206 RepID=A0ABT0S8G8_9SPHN|nr:hypothetical protein [Sphingomonas brevis]MCL6740673.1 hypothetical protein [Sphingomonas brevis]
MNRLKDALFGPHHIVIGLIAVWFGMALMAGEALGFWQPDYRKTLIAIALAYWAFVLNELGLFGRRHNGK